MGEPRHADASQAPGAPPLGPGHAAAVLARLDAALAVTPSSALLWSDRAAVLRDAGLPGEALASCEQALALDARCHGAWFNAGAASLDLNRFAAALACFDEAIGIEPQDARGHAGRGLALARLERLDEAIGAYDAALALDARQAGTWRNRGNASFEAGDVEAAIADFEAALSLDPGIPYLLGDWVHACMSGCVWAPLGEGMRQLELGLAQGRAVVTPFAARCMPLSGPQLLACARIFVGRTLASVPPSPLPTPPTPASDARIRIGYFSGDFREHVMAQLVCGLFEQHDRERFEVFAFAFGEPRPGPMRERIRRGVDRFVDVAAMTDEAVAALAREWRIDIAVDLNGFTRRARPGVFARRAAAVQIGFLGDPGTLGGLVDYLVADHVVVPEAAVGHHAERLVFMPHTYQVNSHVWTPRDSGAVPPTRGSVGLTHDAFVFCALHQSRKITPEAFDVWMRLLREVHGSVLWLLEDNAFATRHLRREAEARGVDPARLVFAPRVSAADHVARLALADLFLDSFDYNAHATATDALWAGLPVVTRLGGTFASRVAASLLAAVGLPECVTTCTADYFALARSLALDGDALHALRCKLEANREVEPLFDTARFTRHWETGLRAIHQRSVQGLPPAQIDIRVRA